MRTVYVPKGETVNYEYLVTDKIIVKGCLNVAYGIKAKSICGNGIICAAAVEADDIRIDSIEAATVVCRRLISKRVQVPELFASESAAISGYLSAAYVETGKLTVAISEVDEVKAEEIVNLRLKKRSLIGTLILSALRSFWTSLIVGENVEAEMETEPEVQEVDNTVELVKETVAAELECQEAEEHEPVDEELNRIVNLFKLSRDAGYTLKIVPGTPEENAPVFDFEKQQIVRSAA